MEEVLSSFDHPKILIKSIFISLPIFWILVRVFFRESGSFLEALRYFFQPGWLSLFRGEFNDDFWETCKLYLFLVLWAASIFAIYKFLQTD